MASNENTGVELIQEQIEYVLVEQQDPGKSGQSASKDLDIIPGLQVISPGSVTSQANLTAMYQFSPLSESISGSEEVSQIQAENILSADALLKSSNKVTASLSSSVAHQDSQVVTTFTTMSEVGDIHSDHQTLHSESMQYIVEVSREMPLTSAQLDSAPVVEIVNDSLSSEVLNSLPPGSHIIFNNTGKKCPQLLAALASKQNDYKNNSNDSDNNMSDSSLTKQALFSKTDVMLTSDIQSFPSGDKDLREMSMGADTDTQISQSDSIQTVIDEQEPDTQTGSVRTLHDCKKLSDESHMKAIQNIAWPQNDTCKVFSNVVASVSKEFFAAVKSESFPSSPINHSGLLEHILLSRRQITDLMIRECDDHLLLAGDLIDIMEIHNVLLSNLQKGLKCKHKPMSAYLPMTKDQAIMCDGVPGVSHSEKKKQSYSDYRDMTSDSEERPVEGSQRRHSRRSRRPPAKLDDDEYPTPKRHHRRHRHKTNNVIIIKPLEEERCQQMDGIMQEDSEGFKLSNTESITVALDASSADTQNIDPNVDFMQSVMKAEDQHLLGEKQFEDDSESLLPIITAAEDSERHDQDKMAQSEEPNKQQEITPKLEKMKILHQKRKNYEELTPFKFFCKECSFKTKRESHFRKHQILHTEKKLPVLHCPKCDYSTLHMAHLRHHEVIHSNNALKCHFCSYRTTSLIQLKKHNRLRHDVKGRHVKDPMQQSCTHCNYTTDKQHLFQRHMLRHMHVDGNRTGMHGMLVKSYQCTHCTYSTDKKDQFVRHMENVHSDSRPHLCDLCGMGFKRTDTLKTHRLVHMDKSQRTYKFFCPQCNKGLRSKAHLEEHMSMHTNKREYLCEICGTAFKTRGIQRRHVATIHTNPSGFTCKLCNKRFNTKYALQRHQRTHEVAELQAQQKQVLEAVNDVGYSEELGSLKVTPDTNTISMPVNDHQGLIHIQPLLQDQELTQQQVITELQVLPIGSTLGQMTQAGDSSQVTVLEEAFGQEQQGLEVQLQPALVQNDNGGTTLLYLTAVSSDVS